MILIILMVVYFMSHFYCLASTSSLDPKSIHSKKYCCFFVYDSGDRIN